jgi:hypothetical protein
VAPVGTDDEVEALLGAAAEAHQHAVAVLLQADDVLAVAVLDAVAGRVGEDVAQVAAQDLDVGDQSAAPERLGGHLDLLPALRVDHPHAALVQRPRLDRVQQAHPLDHAGRGAA